MISTGVAAAVYVYRQVPPRVEDDFVTPDDRLVGERQYKRVYIKCVRRIHTHALHTGEKYDVCNRVHTHTDGVLTVALLCAHHRPPPPLYVHTHTPRRR